MTDSILKQLDNILDERKNASPGSSYVASLYNKGINTILKKVGEESAETIIAAKEDDKKAIIYETADLWFHTMVMLKHHGLSTDDVLNELQRRFGLSGIDEKASRTK